MSNYFIHESSYIDQPCQIGDHTKIWHFSHIMKNTRVGSNCSIGQNAFIGEGVILGDNVKVQNNVSIFTGVSCEDDVFLGPSMVFTNVINPRSFIERKADYLPTRIKKGASIGANATIVCGNTIGSYALIGSGSVITRDIPDFALVYGVPGKLIGWVCKCAHQLEFANHTAICALCKTEYKMITTTRVMERLERSEDGTP